MVNRVISLDKASNTMLCELTECLCLPRSEPSVVENMEPPYQHYEQRTQKVGVNLVSIFLQHFKLFTFIMHNVEYPSFFIRARLICRKIK